MLWASPIRNFRLSVNTLTQMQKYRHFAKGYFKFKQSFLASKEYIHARSLPDKVHAVSSVFNIVDSNAQCAIFNIPPKHSQYNFDNHFFFCW